MTITNDHIYDKQQPFNGDPADPIIVATAREENATILTKDRIIQRYRHVRSLWQERNIRIDIKCNQPDIDYY